MKWWGLGFGLLLLSRVAGAQQQSMGWEYPDEGQKAPESFLITYLSTNNPLVPQQFRVPNGGRASCEGIDAQKNGLTAESVCGRPPTCLSPGHYIFMVQAEHAGAVSLPSNHAPCEMLPNCESQCTNATPPASLTDMAKAVMPSDRVITEMQTPPPDLVTRLTEELGQRPLPPAQASVTRPAPTTQDIPDTIQAALNQMPRTPV